VRRRHGSFDRSRGENSSDPVHGAFSEGVRDRDKAIGLNRTRPSSFLSDRWYPSSWI
jgi:hypothetical protein